MTDRPKCIVCGRNIAKRTERVIVQPISADGFNSGNATVHADIRTKADAQQHTNHVVTSISMGPSGVAWTFNTWDGVSYEDEFFCNGNCARKQAYASARHGQRYVWKS